MAVDGVATPLKIERIARFKGKDVQADVIVHEHCGEAGAIGSPPAVINAITDAIGNNKLEMPATPDRVWAAIHG